MKRFFVPVFISFLFINPLYAQNYSVTFKVIAALQNKNDTIFITGNNRKLGNWSPGVIPLKRINDSTWLRTISFPSNAILEYKYTKGNWQNEALNNNGSIPQNSILKVIRDTIVVKRITKWKDQNIHKNNFKGKITGHIKYFGNVQGEGIKPRDVVVWLPPGYDKDLTMRYPVFYMQDGQNLFDPKTSSFGVDWQADETADSLIKNKIIAPIIIVGIYNTSDRSLEYIPTKKGMAYMKFVATNLKPFIDSTFRTLPGRDFTAVGGSSYGGTISFMLAWYYSNIFSKAACFSPAFKTDRFDLTKIVKNYPGIKKNIKLYIDNGGVGLEEKLQPGINEMISSLKKKRYKLNKDYFWFKDSTARHFEADWAKRLWRPLEIFFEIQTLKPKIHLFNIREEKKVVQKYKLSKRFRIQGTLANTYAGVEDGAVIPFLLSLNLRNSSVDSLDLQKTITLSFAKEAGLNLSFYPELFLFTYFKVGPEIRIKKYFYTDFHIGLGIFAASLFKKFGLLPVPFVGTEIGYINNSFKDHLIEVEAGVNRLPWKYTEVLYYISIGFSF